MKSFPRETQDMVGATLLGWLSGMNTFGFVHQGFLDCWSIELQTSNLGYLLTRLFEPFKPLARICSVFQTFGNTH